MRKGWNSTLLKNVCALEKAKHDGKAVPYVGLEHIESNTGRYLGNPEPIAVKSSTFRFTADHVLFGRLRPYLNKVLLPEFDGHCSSEIFPLRVKPVLNRRFLFYWLTWQPVVEEIDRTSTGARMPRANVSKLLEFEFPLPPLPEQKRIVAILDDAFAGIASVVANTERNFANNRELFESYLSSVFTQRGEGWVDKKLCEVCDGKITDGTHQTPKYYDNGHIFLSSRNVTSGEVDWDNIKYIDQSQHEAMQKRVSPRLGDILLAKNGTTGVAAIVDRDISFDIYVSLALLRPSTEIVSRYLWHFINSPNAKEQFNKRLKGIGVPNLHLNEIREVEIGFPQSILDQERLVEKLDEMLAEKRKLESICQQKLSALSELKQSLLKKAFFGELTAGSEAPKATLKEDGVA